MRRSSRSSREPSPTAPCGPICSRRPDSGPDSLQFGRGRPISHPMSTSSSRETSAENLRQRSAGDGATRTRANGSWGQRRQDRWLERWMETTRDLARLQYSHRMVDAVIEEIDGRQIRIGDQWLTDYASCNYLGLDLDEEIIAAVPEYLARWGTHPSWSRLLGSPVLYEEIETKLTELLGTEDSLVLPTITHIHMSVIPVLAGGGTIFLDKRAHKTIYDGTAFAQGRGASIARFAHNDLDELEALLRGNWRRPGLICTDGINSIVRHLGESYDNVILVGGFSKAYSSLLAFIACPTAIKRVLKTAAPPYLYSGPSPVASLATVLEGLRVNETRGDQLRAKLHHLTWRVLDRIAELGITTPNHSGFPLI